MTESRQFKYNIGFSQSVSSGIIGFHADIYTDDLEDYIKLDEILEKMEKRFRDKNYLVATDIEPKEKGNKKNGSK
jgi:hypothetical protein